MKLKMSVILLFAGLGGAAVGQPSEFAIGRAYYAEGEFRKAAAHFELAVQTDPEDAKSYYWLGMSYQILADIGSPLDRKCRSKARANLTKAVELAPGRPDYRWELFASLLDPGNSSRLARRQAAGILRSLPESDPEYVYMRRQFEQERRESSSAEARIAGLFLAAPRAVYRIAEAPVSAWSSLSQGR